MSEKITITVRNGQEEQKILHDTGQSVLETFLKNGMAQGSFCNGISLCGRCKIRFLKGAVMPCAADRRLFDAAQLREGYRLACQAKPKRDCELELHFAKEAQMYILSEARQGMPEAGPGKDKAGRCTFAAVDIGTTTVVMQLADARTGQVLSTVKFMNPQRCYGLDVLSRIQAATEHGQEMQRSIRQAVVEGVKRMQKESGTACLPELLCVTGNTAMLHIFLGYDTQGLGKSPFWPVSVKAARTAEEGIQICTMPSVSAFVGADVAAGILETGMQETEQIGLLIDLGTNGEMALGNREKILACACAAGPAFEGGADRGIYGADVLGAIACLLDEKLIDAGGYMEHAETCEYQGKQVEITLEKVREVQLAKAAIRAGVELLMKKFGLKSYRQIDHVYLAGGFGFFLSGYAAVRTGLLPKELGEKARTVGNSALAGALRYGRSLMTERDGTLQNGPHGEGMLCTERIEGFNLAEEKEFQETYVGYMDFPKADA